MNIIIRPRARSRPRGLRSISSSPASLTRTSSTCTPASRTGCRSEINSTRMIRIRMPHCMDHSIIPHWGQRCGTVDDLFLAGTGDQTEYSTWFRNSCLGEGINHEAKSKRSRNLSQPGYEKKAIK